MSAPVYGSLVGASVFLTVDGAFRVYDWEGVPVGDFDTLEKAADLVDQLDYLDVDSQYV